MEISKNIKNLVMAAVFMMAGAFGVLATAQNVMAFRCVDGTKAAKPENCVSGNGTDYSGTSFEKNNNLEGVLKGGINLAIGVIGFIAVVVIIYGGFMYTTSAGDSNKVTKAKNAIMYGIIGLVVAMLAFAIVNFVIGGLFKNS